MSTVLAVLCMFFTATAADAQDIVLHPTDVTTISGNWARLDSSSGASNQRMASGDWGWSAADAAEGSPTNYFEATFNAPAWTPYRVWLRMRAGSESKWNDSVWVQLSDSAYAIGTGSALLFNLENCAGCGTSGWGWNGGAWWAAPANVQFTSGGGHTIRIQIREDGVEIDQIVLSPSTYLFASPGSVRDDSTILGRSSGSGGSAGSGSGGGGGAVPGGAFGGTPWAIPGTIQAEDFDHGGEGAGYHDNSSGNNGGSYRSTDVDIAGTGSGGYTVGWAGAGEWLQYTVNVTAAGNYNLIARVASAGGGGTFHINFNGQDKTGSLRVPNTGGWDTYQDVSATVYLDAGVQVMRIALDTNGTTGAVGNFSSIRLETGGSSAAPPPTGGSGSSSPFGGSPFSLPGTIQFEDFDHGGQGVSYVDHSSGNNGGAYRSTDVDIAGTSSGGYTIGWAGAGEWLQYTVNVTSAGHYTLTNRVASAGWGGTFHLEFNGENKTGALTVPNTGGWDSWQDVNATVWLDAGVQTVRLVLDSNGGTGAVGNFSYVRVDVPSAAPAPAPAPEPAPAPAPAPPPPPPPPSGGSGGGRVRVMTWNIHFGHGDPWGQAQFIANSGADVVLLQEAQTWDEDMVTTYPDRLRQLTGQTWYAASTRDSSCGGGCQINLILSRFPILESSLDGNGWTPVRALVSVHGVPVNFFNVHLEYYNTGVRTTQLLEFMDWMRHFPGPRIAGGDFNSWWDEWWIHQMETEYSDTWKDVTGGIEGGYTLNNAVRFDYLFRARDSNWRMTPTAVWVPWTDRSDHLPVVADYDVR